MPTKLDYPATPTVDQLDTYHGTSVADPYRWLEQPADTPEVRAWIGAQNDLTGRWLDARPARRVFRERLTALWDAPRLGVPFRKGGRLFQFRNRGLQNQSVLYVSNPGADHPDAATRVLLDPNAFSGDGTVALTGFSLSRDGARLAYAVSDGGSDWKSWRVRDVASGDDLPDTISWSKFTTATWLPGNEAFLYAAYPEPAAGEALTGTNRAPRLKLHRLGDDPADDVTVLHRPDDPDWMFHPWISHDGRWLTVHVGRGTDPANQLWVRSLESGANEPAALAALELERDFAPLQGAFVGATTPVGSEGDTLYLLTDVDAPRYRLVAADLGAPGGPATWREVVAEGEYLIERARLQRGALWLVRLADASHRLERYRTVPDAPAEALGEIPLPTLGSVAELAAEPDDDELFFSFTSYLFPATPHRVRRGEARAETLADPEIGLDPSDYVTRQLWATSADGTRVPMFVTHRAELPTSGDHPTLLYGYGGFDISLTPSFSASRLAWLEQGGVLAVANLRGGGEYGRAWHDAGRLANKQNVFDDAVACAETLMAEGITNRDRLAIQGGSNGGLLVGALITQRPDLFGAAHAAVGVLDMLRFHRFTIGWAWTRDYGSADDPEQFRTLFAYSPLHNLEPGTSYPPTLITTGDHDDRVVPAHSFKFAAALQAAQGAPAPVLIRIETRAGHGMGKPTRLVIEETADVWTFLADALGMEPALPADAAESRVATGSSDLAARP